MRDVYGIIYTVIIYSLDDALGKTIMRRMRVCCSAYIYYYIVVFIGFQSVLLVKTKCIMTTIIIIKKAKKSPVHESTGSRLQHPHRAV